MTTNRALFPEPALAGVDLETAFNAVAPQLEALHTAELATINLDISSSINAATRVLPTLMTMRPLIVQQLPLFDVGAFDRLPTFTRVLSYVHSLHLDALASQAQVRGTLNDADRLRRALLADATALINRGHLNATLLTHLLGKSGTKHVRADLATLVSAFNDSWATLHDHCAIRQDDLVYASRLAMQLGDVAHLREQGRTRLARTTDLRLRAFTLFSRTYDDARRAVTYLRWQHGDVDAIVPSLYAGRSNGRTGTGRKS